MDEPEHTAYRQVTQAQFMPQSLDAAGRPHPRDRAAPRRPHGGRWAAAATSRPTSRSSYPLAGDPRHHRRARARTTRKMLRLTQWLFTYADPDLCRPGAEHHRPGRDHQDLGHRVPRVQGLLRGRHPRPPRLPARRRRLADRQRPGERLPDGRARDDLLLRDRLDRRARHDLGDHRDLDVGAGRAAAAARAAQGRTPR